MRLPWVLAGPEVALKDAQKEEIRFLGNLYMCLGGGGVHIQCPVLQNGCVGALTKACLNFS